ncbi:MAG: glycosyltransferase family 2 protein, partial [Metallosphaera sp.]
GDIIGIFDADTVPKLDDLAYVASKFKDERVAAVQGMLLPINVRESIISRFASIEELIYEYSIAGRARLGFFIPLEGTLTFIRKDVIEKLGGFNEYSLTEDLDLSLKLIANGYKIVYLPSAVAWREVPISLRSLIKQRLRWYRGHLEVRIGKVRLDWRIIDGVLILATPIFIVMNVVNYSIAIFFPNFIVIVAALISGVASIISLGLVIIISRLHMIEFFYSFLTFFYFNLVLGLNMTAIFMEIIKYPRFWIKTERSGGITI